MRSYSPSSYSTSFLRMFVPTLLTRMSRRSSPSNMRRRSAAFATSAFTSALLRATRTTRAPKLSSSFAIARPMPFVAPVTRAVRPSRLHLPDLTLQHSPQFLRDPADLRAVLAFHHHAHEVLRARVAHEDSSAPIQVLHRLRMRGL